MTTYHHTDNPILPHRRRELAATVADTIYQNGSSMTAQAIADRVLTARDLEEDATYITKFGVHCTVREAVESQVRMVLQVLRSAGDVSGGNGDGVWQLTEAGIARARARADIRLAISQLTERLSQLSEYKEGGKRS